MDNQEHTHDHRNHDDHQHHHDHNHHRHMAEPGTKSATDPVCGMQVTIKDGVRSQDYDGETFYFCSDGCQEKYQRRSLFLCLRECQRGGPTDPAGDTMDLSHAPGDHPRRTGPPAPNAAWHWSRRFPLMSHPKNSSISLGGSG